MRFVGVSNINKSYRGNMSNDLTSSWTFHMLQHQISDWLRFLSPDIIGWDYVMVSLFHLLEIYLFWRTISLTAVGIDLFPVGLEVVDL